MSNIPELKEETMIPIVPVYLENNKQDDPITTVMNNLPRKSFDSGILKTAGYEKINHTHIKGLFLAQKNSAATNDGIDVNAATEIQDNTVYNLTNFTAGKQLFLKYNVKDIKKASAIIQFNVTTNTEVIVFTVDENNKPNIVAVNYHMLDKADTSVFVPKSTGMYYMMFIVNDGGGDANVALLTSAQYSEHEPNDNPVEALVQHDSAYTIDTYDNAYDIDFIRLNITKTEPMVISIAFNDKDITGNINLGIFHKADENGNAINKWLVNQQITVPAFDILWDNTDLKGEFYISTSYSSGDIINKPYTLTVTPASKLPFPMYISTGEKGVTGNQSGYISGYHWVIGSFKAIADFRSSLSQNSDGSYPCFPAKILLVGNDANQKLDFKHNANFSKPVITSSDGLATISALLPGTYGKDGSFRGEKYSHQYDVNRAFFYFLKCEKKDKQTKATLSWVSSTKIVCAFDPFLNVVK